MRILPITKWWQAALFWGLAMLLLNIIKDVVNDQVTIERLGKEALIWGAAGLAFGVLLTALLSLIAHKNLFRGGFPEKRGTR